MPDKPNTDTTDATFSPEDFTMRMETFIDGIAEANYAARFHAEELVRLRMTILFGTIMLAGLYVLRGGKVNISGTP